MNFTLIAQVAAAVWLLQPMPTTPLELRPVTIPTFDSEPGIRWSASREEYEAARADERFGGR